MMRKEIYRLMVEDETWLHAYRIFLLQPAAWTITWDKLGLRDRLAYWEQADAMLQPPKAVEDLDLAWPS